MARYCHFYVYKNRQGVIETFQYARCNLYYGCGEPGCCYARGGHGYNDLGGYNVEPGDEIDIFDVGTPAQLAYIDWLDSFSRWLDIKRFSFRNKDRITTSLEKLEIPYEFVYHMNDHDDAYQLPTGEQVTLLS